MCLSDAEIWHLVATRVRKLDVTYSLEKTAKYARIEYTMYIDRKPLYYIVNIMMPCSFLVIISLLVRPISLISVLFHSLQQMKNP